MSATIESDEANAQIPTEVVALSEGDSGYLGNVLMRLCALSDVEAVLNCAQQLSFGQVYLYVHIRVPLFFECIFLFSIFGSVLFSFRWQWPSRGSFLIDTTETKSRYHR